MILARMSPLAILRSHFATMRDHATKRPNWGERLVHTLVPIAAGVAAYALGVTFVADTAALVATALSVFGGLLFNLLVSASSMRMANRGSRSFDDARELSKQLLVNIEFSLLVSFVCIALLLPGTVTVRRIPSFLVAANAVAIDVAAAFAVTFLASFGLTLLIIIQRMHVTMTQNIDVTYDIAPKVEVALPPHTPVAPSPTATGSRPRPRRSQQSH